MNRYEKREFNQLKKAQALHGEGIYVYRNNSGADMESLPKATLSGSRRVGKGQEFQGDSYFLQFIGKGLTLVRTIVPAGSVAQPAPVTEEVLMENQKLILDQPDTVTIGGKIEHHIKQSEHQPASNKYKEIAGDRQGEEVLLTEDPLAGIEILAD